MDILNEEKIVQGLEKDLKNLKPGDESTRIELNKRLIERYPFLECRGWNTSKPRDYYFTWLDHIHEGWKKHLVSAYAKN